MSALVDSSGSLQIPLTPADSTEHTLRLSLVIPTRNEAANLPALVAALEGVLEPLLAGRYELIVVDDDSPDRTWELAQRLAEKHPALRVLRRERERGLSTAVIRGWQLARGDVLAVIDADLQHPPEACVALWQEIERGADLAVASRHVTGGGVSDWSLTRRLLSRGAQLLGLIFLPGVFARLSDPMSGYFMVRRAAVAELELNPLGYKILIEVAARGKIRWIGEVPYVFRERVEGNSKVTARIYLEYLLHLARLRWSTLAKSTFLRFALVGASGVLVDMGLLYALGDPRALGLGLTRSKLVAAEAAIVNNFLWNDAWTFGAVSREQRRLAQKWRRFLKFNAICGAGLLFNVLILNVLYNFAGLDRYLANAIAIALVTAWNYWVNARFNWRVTEL